MSWIPTRIDRFCFNLFFSRNSFFFYLKLDPTGIKRQPMPRSSAGAAAYLPQVVQLTDVIDLQVVEPGLQGQVEWT